ncbi:MAG: RNA methyltransferase [Gemmatimonadota bacterium]|jgi:TrmH family RNA methyltransferase
MASTLVTTVRNLHQRKGRRRRGLTLAEGLRVVEEAIASGVEIRGVLAAASFGTAPRAAALLTALADRAIPIEELPDRAFAGLADTGHPQGVLAVIEVPTWTLADVVPAVRAPVLVLDAVQDPGNVGTLVRTGFALGAAGAVLLRGCAEPTNPKTVRAAMGASFRLPIATADHAAFARWCQRERVELWTAAAEGTPLGRAAVPERLALVVGNEGAGVSAELRALAVRQVAIPLARGAESLNVAVAAGILLYEVARAT